MAEPPLTLEVLPGLLAVCRLGPSQPVPEWVLRLPFWSLTRTEDEISIVLPETLAAPGWKQETGFRALKVRGPLDFGLIGVMARLTAALAGAQVSLVAISTYDTDYVLVRDSDLGRAVSALREAGCAVASGSVRVDRGKPISPRRR
ncbi:MAG TPA: ACT domain-containing protein [Thermoanaerobaculia bacterium]|nr:ACT domain-containing protein [Thermoanaerobaculia bacterium]